MASASTRTLSAESLVVRARDRTRRPLRPVVVTGVLVVHDGAPWLNESLDALALQTRRLDRLVIVDTGSTDDSLQIAATHGGSKDVIGDVTVLSMPQIGTFGEAVGSAVSQLSQPSQPSQPARPSPSPQLSHPREPPHPSQLSELSTEPLAARSPDSAEWLWLLHDDSAADPAALAHLLDAARKTPSVGVAGPKITTWDDPSRLLEVGLVITRSGRRVGSPVPGEPDQGQHDLRSDVLGVSTSGMLIRCDVFDSLGGFDPAFGQSCDGLDLCWRAQLAGHRVVVAPMARMREAAASTRGQRSAELSVTAARRRDRRHGRQVALARCSPYAAPFLALWIAVASLGSAAFLLVAKRPRAAWAELGDLGSLLTPWRPLAARWRARGTGRVRRRDLRGLFASPRTGFHQDLDSIHVALALDPAPPGDDVVGEARSLGPQAPETRAPETQSRVPQSREPQSRELQSPGTPAPETGPVSDDAELFVEPRGSMGSRTLRHPGFLVVMVGALLAAATWRSLLGTVLHAGGLGLSGGELLPVTSDASALWHSWLDGWHGAGLGNAAESPPYLLVLASGAWLLEHLPLVNTSTSSVGVLIGWLLVGAIPLSAWTAYLASGVVTRARWPRAWAALAWATLATLTTAAAGGRVGAVVAHVLLPLVAAGFVGAARRSTGSAATFGGAIALGVTGAFNPMLGVLGALAALILLVVGHGVTRLRAAVLLLVPIGLLGPWVLRLAENPLLLLTGPGLTVWQGAAPVPWQLALLHPGGPGTYPALLSAPIVLLSAPIVLAGVVALRREAGSPAMTVLAALTLAGLALGLASPRAVIGLTPQGIAGAGAPITVWAGTGLDLAALALVAAALLGYRGLRAPRNGLGARQDGLGARQDGLGARRDRRLGGLAGSGVGWRKILLFPLVAAAVLGVVASAGMAGWLGVGDTLAPAVPKIPAVAADQTQEPSGNRVLTMTRDAGTLGYQLVGREPGPTVRDLPGATTSPDPLLVQAVSGLVGRGALVGESGGSSGSAVHDGLASLGIGFVAFRGPAAEPLVTQIDATAGLTRLSDTQGLILWRVLPGQRAVRPSRLRLVDAKGAVLAAIPVTGDHGRTTVTLGPATPEAQRSGRRIVLAEPAAWAEHARVTFGGRELTAVAGGDQPTYLLPSDPGRLSITLPPTYQWWRRGQLALLLIVIFLAVPSGSARSRRSS